MKKIYIAGPMRGKPRFNHELFDACASAVFRTFPDGDVYNPAAKDRNLGFDPDTGKMDRDSKFPDFESFLRHVKQLSIDQVKASDVIVLLPEWWLSEGASAEAFVARFLGLDVYVYDPEEWVIRKRTWARFGLKGVYIPHSEEVSVEDENKLAAGPDPEPAKVEGFLEEVADITSRDRNRDYGDPKDNLGQIADMWSTYLSRKLKDGATVTGRDVGWMNILQKASRDSNRAKRDNLVDAAGYSRITEEAFPAV